jgi:predicted nucleic-acid-binding Zn-ribbon protein
MTDTQWCPECGGHNGYKGTLTETHQVSGAWGFVPEAGDSGINARYSLMKCIDCGFTFRMDSKRTADWKQYPYGSK